MTEGDIRQVLVRQIVEELDVAIAGPVGTLVGIDLAQLVRDRVSSVAPVLASQLTDDDERLVAQTVIDLMCALWPDASPEDCGQADWWRTPLGRACAASLGRGDSESVSQSVAAAMLGVTTGTVAQLVHRGTLERHSQGGVARASVLSRVARLAAQRS